MVHINKTHINWLIKELEKEITISIHKQNHVHTQGNKFGSVGYSLLSIHYWLFPHLYLLIPHIKSFQFIISYGDQLTYVCLVQSGLRQYHSWRYFMEKMTYPECIVSYSNDIKAVILKNWFCGVGVFFFHGFKEKDWNKTEGINEVKYLRFLNAQWASRKEKAVSATLSTHCFTVWLSGNLSVGFGYYCESDLSRRNS